MNTIIRYAWGGGVLLLLCAACGNKGPLVMPQRPVPVEEAPVESNAVQNDTAEAEQDDEAYDVLNAPISDDE